MPGLLLQKLRKSSKAKDHLNALERRLRLWEEGKILELLDKNRTIQERLLSSNTSMNIKKISSKYKPLMQKENVYGALRLLV